MSAAIFARLIDEFRAGWTELDNAHFNLEIRVPGRVSTWEPAFNPDEFEFLASVCLPFRESPASDDDFTHAGCAVIQKCPRDKRCMAGINTFKQLSREAGAALPDVIRERLVGYCPWDCSSPACWWIALLAYARGITAYNAANFYQVKHGIERPWLISIEMIERLGLNTDSPGWEQEREPVGENASEQHSQTRTPTKAKRSTERGEGRTKLIAALTKHHKYADGGCLNLEPIGNNELARLAGVVNSTASEFFDAKFGGPDGKDGHAKYKIVCRDVGRLVDSLKALNGELSPHDLYGRRPPGERERDDE